MSPAALLKNVKKKFPELGDLPKTKLKLVEEAILYVSQIRPTYDLLTPAESAKLRRDLGGKRTPGRALRAYRYREDLTQVELAKKSGIPQANLSAFENDRRTIGVKAAKKLALILNCRFERLLA